MNEDDLLKDMAGRDRGEAPPEASYRMCVDERCVNSIEAEMKERLILECSASKSLPFIFIDAATDELDPPTDGRPEPWAKYFDGRVPAPWECADLAKDIFALIEAQPNVIAIRRKITIARGLGPRATREQFAEACKKEGLNHE